MFTLIFRIDVGFLEFSAQVELARLPSTMFHLSCAVYARIRCGYSSFFLALT